LIIKFLIVSKQYYLNKTQHTNIQIQKITIYINMATSCNTTPIVFKINSTVEQRHLARQMPDSIDNIVKWIETGDNKSIYEVIHDDTYIKPYFDWDIKCKDEIEAINMYEKIKECVYMDLDIMFKPYGYSHNDSRFVIAERPIGYCPVSHKYKISFRAYVLESKTTKASLNVLMNKYGIRSKIGLSEYMDGSIYDKNRVINMVGCCKGDVLNNIYDNRILNILSEGHTLKDSIINIVSDDDNTLFVLKDEIKNEYEAEEKAQYKVKRKIDDYSTNYVELGKIVELLSKERATEYHKWLYVGLALKSELFKSGVCLKELFHQFSKKCENKYDENKVDKHWDNINERNNGYSIGSIYHWAKRDNPTQYQKLKNEDLNALLMTSLSETDTDMAHVIKYMFGHLYKCVDIKKNTFYEFKNHRWEICPDAYTLSNKISTTLFQKFVELKNEYQKQSGECVEPDEVSRLNNLSKQCHTVGRKLKFQNKKKDLIKEVSALLYDKKLKEKLDYANPHLIGFENGVLDLDTREFREGRPDDYITFSTKYDYTKEINENINKELTQFLKDITVSDEYYTYMLDTLSYMLQGRKHLELFMVWTGIGSNGKSVLSTMISKMLGDYGYSPDVSVLTCKKTSSSGSNGEVAKMKGKRFLIMQEPEKDEVIWVSNVKKLTGGDEVQARDLYDDFKEFNLHGLLCICCNGLPNLSASDGGILRRMRVQKFENTFKEDPDLENPHEKLVDFTFKEKCKSNIYHQQLILILIQHYYDMVDAGGTNFNINVPKSIAEASKDYVQENDDIQCFIEEYCVVTKNNDKKCFEDDLHVMFKENSDVKIKTKEFYSVMKDKGFKVTNVHNRKRIYGIKLKEDDTQIDNEDEDGLECCN